MENYYHNLILDIAKCFVTEDDEQGTGVHFRNVMSLIRIHDKNFTPAGEVSFPCDPNLWEKYFSSVSGFKLDQEAIALSEEDKNKCERFLAKGQKWSFPLSHLNIRKERCHLYMQRKFVISKLIPEVLKNTNFGKLVKNVDAKVYLKQLQKYDQCDENLLYHRVKLVHQTLKNLLIYSRYSVQEEPHSNAATIVVLSADCNALKDDKNKAEMNVKCGPVIYPAENGTVFRMTTEQYMRCRLEHVRKMSLFRSRQMMQDDHCFNELMSRLGCADVTVSLLEVKHTSPVQIKAVGVGGTKGALFLLYNTARLETILRTFNERIKIQQYEPQPNMEDIDWSVLKEEEEWQLVFTYLAGFPDLIDRCVEHLERGVFAVHLIIHFLNGLVSLFSKYYIRIRILTEKRDHLMPYVYARIYLLQAVREILNKTLAFLDIKPVESM